MLAASPRCASSMLGVANLEAPERFVLWAVRAWSAHHSDLSDVWSTLDLAFTELGIREALRPFDRTMSVLFCGLQQWPDIRCVRCPRLGADEMRVLSAFSDLQCNRPEAARLLLGQFATRVAARVACEFAAGFVEIATCAGLRFTSPGCDAANEQLSQLKPEMRADITSSVLH